MSKKVVLRLVLGMLVILWGTLAIAGCQAPNGAVGSRPIEPSFGDGGDGGEGGAGGDGARQPGEGVADDRETDGLATDDFPGSGDSSAPSTAEDTFGLFGPAFPGLGLQSHTTECDPFDNSYGACL